MPSVQQARTFVALFGSDDCTDCAAFKEEWLERYNEPEDPALLYLPVDHQGNYELLDKLEKAVNLEKKSSSFPILFAGGRFILNIDDFWENEAKYMEIAASSNLPPEAAPLKTAAESSNENLIRFIAPESNSDAADGTPQPNVPLSEGEHGLLFFYQKGCAKCSRQEKEFEILLKLLPKLEIARYDVATMDGQIMLTRFNALFPRDDMNKNPAPLIAWGQDYTMDFITAEQLAEKILNNKGTIFWTEPVTGKERLQAKAGAAGALDSFVVTTVMLSGAADGINPCAFATSIFLISYLVMQKRRKKQVALIGFTFCAGVFAAYLLFGLGLSFLIDFLNSFQWVKSCIYSAFAVISLLLAAGHARDAWRFRKTGKTGDMALGLSQETHKGIHGKIRQFTKASSWMLAPAAFVLGIVVSSMELACTGQIYLPVLAAINSTGVTLKSFYLLVLYNLCFIAPLLLITASAMMGVKISFFTEWAKNNIFKTKLAMSFVFAVIAVIMTAIVLAK